MYTAQRQCKLGVDPGFFFSIFLFIYNNNNNVVFISFAIRNTCNMNLIELVHR